MQKIENIVKKQQAEAIATIYSKDKGKICFSNEKEEKYDNDIVDNNIDSD